MTVISSINPGDLFRHAQQSQYITLIITAEYDEDLNCWIGLRTHAKHPHMIFNYKVQIVSWYTWWVKIA